jgi:membrane protein YdbS with pleckstrin-like domain
VALSRRLLSEGEHVVVTTRTHVKALLGPATWLILVAAVAGYASSFAPSGNARPLVVAAVWVVALAAIIWLVVKPFLAWLTTTYTVTDRRLITRSGILSRRGHDIPLLRVSDVAYEHGILDRLLGCGTLVVSTASERGQVRLPDIPHVEHVHLQVGDLLYSHDQGERRLDDGT